MKALKVIVLAAALLVPAFPVAPVQAAPRIEFLNPSDYQTTLTLSDKEDNDSYYHVVTWVSEMPPNPSVELEFRTILGNVTTSFDAGPAAGDTFEAHVASSQLDDGQYRLRATLFSGESSVAETLETVTINSDSVVPPPAAETVEMPFPIEGGSLRFFSPPGARPTTVIDGIASEAALQARALYTTSRPGTDPFWRECGSGDVADDGFVRVKCTLNAGDQSTAVTAVALVANESPPSTPPRAEADQSGDAHRVFPVDSVPTLVQITPDTMTTDVGVCRRLVATATDQDGRPVAGATIDVHAVGPTDSLSFGVIVDPTPTRETGTDEFRKPDHGHFGDEAAINCLEERDAEARQGEHNLPGQDDTKHIESVARTDASGRFRFALHSNDTGGTEIVAWVDANDDDTLDLLEASGGSVLGWGQAPPEPTTTVTLRPQATSAGVGECLTFHGVAKEGGSPIAGANLDVHLTGPDASAAFCTSGEDDSPVAAPDAGGHSGDVHADDGSRHGEVRTSDVGGFSFGITSTGTGSSLVVAWHDRFDDDTRGGDEAADSRSVSWQPQPPRSISIDSNKASARKRSSVMLFGTVAGPSVCSNGETPQLVNLKVRRRGSMGLGFRTIGTTTVGSTGTYSFRVTLRRSSTFRAVAPAVGVCHQVASKLVRIRATAPAGSTSST